MLEKKQRIELPLPVEQWLKEATTGSEVDVFPITCDISCLAGTLPEYHKDPADRIIIATAITMAAPVVTKDEKLLDYPHVKTIW